MPKTFTHSVEFGLGAGILVGIASISNFKKNIKANIDVMNVFRGASYGLYGGIILGLYLTYFVSDQKPADPPIILDSPQPQGGLPSTQQNIGFNLVFPAINF